MNGILRSLASIIRRYLHWRSALLANCLGITLAIGSVLAAQGQMEPQTTGSIRGSMVGADGVPLAAITVTIYRSSQYGSWDIYRVATTGADGAYYVPTLVTGRYRIGYSAADGFWQLGYLGSESSLSEAQDVFVAANDIILPTVTMRPAGVIQGALSMYDGQLPQEATVTVYESNSAHSRQVKVTATGSGPLPFSVGGLPAGNYSLSIGATYRDQSFYDSFAPSPKNNRPLIGVTAGAVTQLPAIVIGSDPDSGQISGRVTDDTGQSVGGVMVEARGSWGIRSQKTDAAGQFTLPLIPTGEFLLRAYGGEVYASTWYGNVTWSELSPFLRLTAGEHLQGLDIQMVRSGAIDTSIRLQYDRPLNHRGWTLYGRIDADQEWQVLASKETYSGQQYTVFAGLAPGLYRLAVEGSAEEGYGFNNRYKEFYQQSLELDTATDIVVTAGQTTTVAAVLGNAPEYARIAGAVKASSGAALADILVSAQIRAESAWRTIRTARTDGNGNYLLDSLPPNRYRLVFTDGRSRYQLLEFYGESQAEGGILLAAGETRNIVDMHMKPYRKISGSLRMFDNSYIDKGMVAFAVYQNTDLGWRQINSIAAATGTTSAVMTYTLDGLLPVEYRLAVKVSSGVRSYTTFFGQANTLEQAASITITDAADVSGIDIIVGSDQDAGSIVGAVVGYSQRLPGATVTLFYESYCWISSNVVSQTVTDGEGRFRFDALPRGYYCVRAELDGTVSLERNVHLEADDSAVVIEVDLYRQPNRMYLPVVAR